MNNIKTNFSIKDLENLSGIKAHTIRIWEKRYNLLEPERSDTNIRSYSLDSLQKLLNVVLLNEKGLKISKIAELSNQDIQIKIREIAAKNDIENQSINDFKLAMFNFDQNSFDLTYNKLLTQYSFREIFLNIFIGLLDDIGLLWQSDTITPAHEHFISNLIKQKLLINIERVQSSKNKSNKTFVLFLPMNEIHELGLLYINFELALQGHNCIYLGQSIPIENLKQFHKFFNNIHFVSYFTVEPHEENLEKYISELNSIILTNNSKIHLLGRNTKTLTSENNISIYKSILDFTSSI